MKKILLASLLVVAVSYAEDSFAEHERKMQQMQERTQIKNGDGSGQQKRNRYKNQNRSGETNDAGSRSGSGNMYKGSNDGGRGRR